MTGQVDDLIDRALAEDAPWGDITSEALVPPGARASAVLAAREPGILSGIEVFARVFARVDADLVVEPFLTDGDTFVAGDIVAEVSGSAHGVLRGERVALNLVQRMCGIATETSRYVSAVAGTKARIVDTRKTTAGLRVLERQAVRDGGGRNHRFSLSDAVLIKDNHLAVLAAAGLDGAEAIRRVRDRVGHTTHIEVEVDRLDQIEPVVLAGIDTILLDNFSVADLRAGVELVAGRVRVEASGGVTLVTVAAIAETGVDLISVGALTHGVRALDLGLDLGLDAEIVS